MEKTECSETSAHKIQTPVNDPKEKDTTFGTRRKFEIENVKFLGVFIFPFNLPTT